MLCFFSERLNLITVKISLNGKVSNNMVVIEDFSLELLNKIFSTLDRESLITASNVCVSWRRIIHDFTSPPSSSDAHFRDKLEKCGWNMNEHDIENCNCIELNKSLLKFIGNRSMSCRDLCQIKTDVNLENIYYARSNSQLCFIREESTRKNVSYFQLKSFS